MSTTLVERIRVPLMRSDADQSPEVRPTSAADEAAATLRPADLIRLPAETGTRARAIDATLRCFARYGANKTTIDDVAREAKCSRATLYRAFPGGKDELVGAVVRSEVRRFFGGLTGRLAGITELESKNSRSLPAGH
jgi:AcrR family transcriptional regulator